MENINNGKYTPNEVLQIVIDVYNFQIIHDSEVYEHEKGLTFSTTIKEWRRICDLVRPRKLVRGHISFFNLKGDTTKFRDIIVNEKENTLKDYCCYISKHADNEGVKHIHSLLESENIENAIFKTVKSNLKQIGVDVSNFKQNTDFSYFFSKYPLEVLEVVSKITPGVIGKYQIKNPIELKVNDFESVEDLIKEMKKQLKAPANL